MPEQKYSPTYIDNRPYAVTMPTFSQWSALLSVVGESTLKHNESDKIFHWMGIASWSLQPAERNKSIKWLIGGSAPTACTVRPLNSRDTSLGFRPVLIPLDPDTLLPDNSQIERLTDGVVMKLGSLYMDGRKVTTMYPDGNYIPDYKPGSLVQLGDSSLDIYSQINFIKCRDFLIADRNILKNISWEDLDKCGLARGNGISSPEMFIKKPNLDDMIHAALKESQKQVEQKLSPEMEQAIKDNIRKCLAENEL